MHMSAHNTHCVRYICQASYGTNRLDAQEDVGIFLYLLAYLIRHTASHLDQSVLIPIDIQAIKYSPTFIGEDHRDDSYDKDNQIKLLQLRDLLVLEKDHEDKLVLCTKSAKQSI